MLRDEWVEEVRRIWMLAEDSPISGHFHFPPLLRIARLPPFIDAVLHDVPYMCICQCHPVLSLQHSYRGLSTSITAIFPPMLP
uniref:Uncharacterized protein n=1 Tax=Setaria digitata TaxID=48799 RepID=A0A915Q369_9BILA